MSLTIRVLVYDLIRLAVIAAKHEKCREIQRELDLTAVQGHPTSSILASMESPYVTSYWSLIVTLAVSDNVFEIFTLKERKLPSLPIRPLFDAPARGNPLEFLNGTYPAKN